VIKISSIPKISQGCLVANKRFSREFIKDIIFCLAGSIFENLGVCFYGSVVIDRDLESSGVLVAHFQAGKFTHLEFKGKATKQTFTERSFDEK
jgi:hypothetical protein